MTILQYCSVCKTEYDMEIVPTSDDDGVLWLQCPNCRGFLPKVDPGPPRTAADAEQAPEPPPKTAPAEPIEDTAPELPDPDLAAADLDAVAAALPADLDPDVADDDDAAPPADEDEGVELLEAMDVSQAVPYRPWKTYAVGDVVHHLAWDDYGVVLAKEMLPGNRSVAKVRFAEAGVVRLIEDQGEAPH